MIPVSVVIITLNEEKRLANCLRSLPRGSEVVVLDSGSSDRTEQIAREFGAKFHTRAFTNHADQKNAALTHASRPWILAVDADEVLSTELAGEVTRLSQEQSPAHQAYAVKRKLVFMNKRLNFGKSTDWPVRFFKQASGRYHSEIHEHFVLDYGSNGKLLESMDHFSYDSIEDYFERFNRYTTLIAANHVKSGKSKVNMMSHLLRPWFEFINRYVLRCGFLDGYPGYTYALLSSFYTFVKYAKFRELTRPELKPS